MSTSQSRAKLLRRGCTFCVINRVWAEMRLRLNLLAIGGATLANNYVCLQLTGKVCFVCYSTPVSVLRCLAVMQLHNLGFEESKSGWCRLKMEGRLRM